MVTYLHSRFDDERSLDFDLQVIDEILADYHYLEKLDPHHDLLSYISRMDRSVIKLEGSELLDSFQIYFNQNEDYDKEKNYPLSSLLDWYAMKLRRRCRVLGDSKISST